MMAAAAAGATAFQKGLGAIHALSHPVGALYDTHHGLTNAVFVPYVLAFNRKAIDDKIKRLAAYIGLRPNFRAFMDFVLELREQTGIPHTLAGLKVGDDKVDHDREDGAGGPDRRRQSGQARQARRAHHLSPRVGRSNLKCRHHLAGKQAQRGGGIGVAHGAEDHLADEIVDAGLAPECVSILTHGVGRAGDAVADRLQLGEGFGIDGRERKRDTRPLPR